MRYEVIRIKNGQYEDNPEYETNNYHDAMNYCQKTMNQERNWIYSETHKNEALVIMKDTKKVKSFRMTEKTEYKLKVLSKQWGMGTGKYLEKLIDKEYLKWISSPRVVYNKQIIDAEWITPDRPEDR